MAKFCTKCGSELVDSKCPKCGEKKEEKVVTVEQEDIKTSFMSCLEVFKGIFTKPIDTIKSFVCENKFIAGIIMVVFAAISAGIYKLTLLKNIYTSKNADSFTASDLTDMLNNVLQGGGLKAAEPEYFKEFLTTFITNFAEYALIVGIGYLIITSILKGKATIKEMVTAVGISLSVIIAANLLNSIVVFIDGEFFAHLRIYIASFGTILSTLILYGSVKQVAGIDNNKLFMSVASMSVLATVVIDIFQKLFN